MLSSASLNAASARVKKQCSHSSISPVATLVRTVSIYLGLNVRVTQLSECRGAAWERTPSTAGAGEKELVMASPTLLARLP